VRSSLLASKSQKLLRLLHARESVLGARVVHGRFFNRDAQSLMLYNDKPPLVGFALEPEVFSRGNLGVYVGGLASR